MSATLGLVKFKSTGNIYMCCYDGTRDIMIPFIFKPEECRDEKGYYCAISYGRKLSSQEWIFPQECNDLDECEIYSAYGGGFYWSGIGSESAKMIKNPFDYNDVTDGDSTDGTPKWVTDFLSNLKKEQNK